MSLFLKWRFSSYFVYFEVKYYLQQQPMIYLHYEGTYEQHQSLSKLDLQSSVFFSPNFQPQFPET